MAQDAKLLNIRSRNYNEISWGFDGGERYGVCRQYSQKDKSQISIVQQLRASDFKMECTYFTLHCFAAFECPVRLLSDTLLFLCMIRNT